MSISGTAGVLCEAWFCGEWAVDDSRFMKVTFGSEIG